MSMRHVTALIAVILMASLLGSVLLVVGCGNGESSPTDSAPHAIEWQTETVVFEAQDLQIATDAGLFVPTSNELDVDSDPGDAEYTSLEVTWFQYNREMRLFIYFQADAYRWWSDEIRTYDGEVDAEWVYYYGNFFDQPLGSTFEGDLELNGVADNGNPVTLTMTGLRLKAFRDVEEGADLETSLRLKLASIGHFFGRYFGVRPSSNLDLGMLVSIIYNDLSPSAQQYYSKEMLEEALADSPAGTLPASDEERILLEEAIDSLASIPVNVEGDRGQISVDLPPGLELLEQPFVLVDNRWLLEPEIGEWTP